MPLPVSPFSIRTDRRLRLLGPVMLFLTGVVFFRLKMYLDISQHLLLNQVLIALGAGFIGWELTRLTVLWIQEKLPGLQKIKARIGALLIALIVLAHIGYLIRVLAHNIFDGRGWYWPSLVDYSDTTGVVIFYATATISVYEIAYLLQQWKRTAAEKEKLIQREWQAKYDLLKAQINPHFLFNSLNSLSSLISEDPAKAELFTDELSKVYRYLLRSSDHEMVTVQHELDFIHSFCRLLEVRYGAGFNVKILVAEKVKEYFLPPLTLQLLVENAVKHNVVSKSEPLRVQIQSEGERLMVSNNIREKKITVPGSGTGLKNIREKYMLMELGEIVIMKNDDCFSVSVPLSRQYA